MSIIASFEAFTEVMCQVEVFWNEGSLDLWNVGILL